MSEILTVNSIIYGAAGFGAGTALGWILKKAAKILFQISMIVIVFFVTALVYLESIHVIAVNERALDNLLNASYVAINTAIQEHGISNPAQYIITTLGLPMTFGFGAGFLYGWFRG